MMKKRFLIGYSGHSYPVIEALKSIGLNFDGYFEVNEMDNNPFHLTFLGNENDYAFTKSDSIFVAIGDNLLRRKISELLKHQMTLLSIVDANSIVRSEIRQNGIIVNAGAIIQPQCTIGDGVIINTRAVVEHECIIGNYVHIAPGAVLTGNVIVGENTLIGANSTVLPEIKIGKNCVIGAGSVVTRDLEDNSVVKGNPARK